MGEDKQDCPGADRPGRTIFRGGVLGALGHRDYSLLWTGALVSNIGTWIQSTALWWYVKETQHSNAWVGAVNMANFIPVLLFVLFAGYMADSLNRKWLVFWSQLAMMLCALALGLASSFGWLSLPLIMVTSAVTGIAFTFGFPAWQALLPDLVPPGEMMNALALSSAQFNLGRAIGPAIGAVILSAWSVGGAFYLNTVSFFLIIVAVLVARPRPVEGRMPISDIFRNTAEGLRYVMRRRWMVVILVTLGITSFFGFSTMILLPSVSKDVHKMGAGAYGFMLGFTGLGAALGAPLVTYANRYFKERDILRASTLGLGLFIVALSFSRTYWLSCLFSVGIGCSFLMMGSAVNTALQSRVEHNMRGRVVGMYIMMYVGIFPIGGQVMGLLSDRTSTPTALLTGGLICAALGLALFLLPGLTRDADSPRVIEPCHPGI